MKRNKGFTLIELLIVVAIIGIIAAIAIPNLLNAVQRGKQKRTIGDMRSVATAVESYAVDNNAYPLQTTIGSINGIGTFLETTYIRKTPINDGWNNAFQYITDAQGQQYTLASYGKNKASEAAVTGIACGTQTRKFENDIVFAVGQFCQQPEGSQNTN